MARPPGDALPWTSAGTVRIMAAEYPSGEMMAAWRGRAWFGSHVDRGDEGISQRPRLWRSAGTERSTVQQCPAVTLCLVVGGEAAHARL